jgi:phosphatidate cytidylyltransferase
MLAGLLLHKWGFIILVTLIMAGSISEYPKLLARIAPRNSWLLFTSLLYIVLPLVLFADLGLNFLGVRGAVRMFDPLLPCAVIFAIWINDTMAYIVGSFIGKTPFSKISPKKTWEGTIGGAILCIACIWGLSTIIGRASVIATSHWLAIAAICAVAGTAGDLFESKLKRLAGVKDSGAVMPGHGGFLDRFDSLLFAAPATWIYVNLFI